MTYKLTMYAYCGMPVPIDEGSLFDMRDRAKRWLERRRKLGYSVDMLTRRGVGWEWEVGEPEDAIMIPDDAGILSIDKDEEE